MPKELTAHSVEPLKKDKVIKIGGRRSSFNRKPGCSPVLIKVSRLLKTGNLTHSFVSHQV